MRHSELKKIAKHSGLTDMMEALNFSVGPSTLWYYRRRDSFIDVLDFWISSSKSHVKVAVACFKEELVYHCDMSEFPKNFNHGLPAHSGSAISKSGVKIGGGSWDISNQLAAEASFIALSSLMNTNVNDWFLKIDSNQALFDSFSPRVQELEIGLKLKKGLGL